MPKARHTDPLTSHQAAARVKHLSETKKAIMRLLFRKTMTDVELIKRYNQLVAIGKAPQASESGIRSRRAELVERGYIAPSGRLERLPSGRNAIVWKPIKRIIL